MDKCSHIVNRHQSELTVTDNANDRLALECSSIPLVACDQILILTMS